LPCKISKDVCSICGGGGYYRLDVELGHPGFGQVYPCEKCNKVVLDERSGLSTQERMINLARLLTTERPGAAKMKYVSERFIKKPVGFAAFFGGYGNGKTLALQAIVNGCLARGVEARYLTGKELVLYLREAFDPQVKDTDVARINQLARVPVLCIDELADAGNTPYAREMQQHLINARYRYSTTLGTVFAWNVTWMDIPWPGVVSRIREFDYNVVEVKDADLRPALGAAKTKMIAAQDTREAVFDMGSGERAFQGQWSEK
jgi:hypothetical protein